MTAEPAVRPETPAECALRAVHRARRMIAADGGALLVMDPVTRLFSTGAVDELPAASCHPFFEFELTEEPRTFRRLVAERREASAVAAGAAPDDPLVRDVLTPYGFGAEVRAVCASGQAVWGGITLWRAAGAPPYTPAEVARLQRLSTDVGEELRHAVVGSLSAASGEGTAPPGLLVLQDGVVAESSPDADALLRELGHGRSDEYRHLDHLRALCSGPVPFSTVLRTSEGWITAHGTRLGTGRVAITLTTAGPEMLLGARVLAAGLSAREIEVTRLLCRGLSDREVARELGVSEHTAHDHVRSVRRKLGVRSRAEVSAAIFADRYFDGFLATAAVTHSG